MDKPIRTTSVTSQLGVSSQSVFTRLAPARLFRKFGYALLPFLEGFESYLDLGCGKRPAIETLSSYYICLDRFLPDLRRLMIPGAFQRPECVLADARNLPFRAKSVDCVLAVDLLEHLEKDEGRLLLDNMERTAKRRVVVMTPNGYLPQEECNGNPFQVHRSMWNPADFESEGYSVYGLNGLRFLRGDLAAPKWRPPGFWNEICEISQVFVWRAPSAAFHLLAYKELDR